MPIDIETSGSGAGEAPEEMTNATTAAASADATTPTEDLSFEDEAAMVEAAKRAGEKAAEESLAAEAEAQQADLQSQVEHMGEELEAAKKEAADASDRLLRLQADWENYRRRTAAERVAERERAAENLVTSLLPVLDDLERASEHAASNADGDEKVNQFVKGVMAVHAKMLDILGKEGVAPIDPVGEAFDPLVHQAVGREENTDVFDETVAQVYQKGYRMGDKVIRSAMVTVTFGGPKRPEEDGVTSEE